MTARNEFIAKWIFNDKGFVIGTERKEDLIRCKDCQHWSPVFGLCFKHKDIAIATDETDWCSRAERKEE